MYIFSNAIDCQCSFLRVIMVYRVIVKSESVG